MRPITDGTGPSDRHAGDEAEHRADRVPCDEQHQRAQRTLAKARPVVDIDLDQRLRCREERARQQIKFRGHQLPQSEQQRERDEPWTRSDKPWEIDVDAGTACCRSNAKPIAAMQPASKPAGPTSPTSGHRAVNQAISQPGNRRQHPAPPYPVTCQARSARQRPDRVRPDRSRASSVTCCRTSAQTRSANWAGSVLDLNTAACFSSCA